MPAVVLGMKSSREFIPLGAHIPIGKADDKQMHNVNTLLNCRKWQKMRPREK